MTKRELSNKLHQVSEMLNELCDLYEEELLPASAEDVEWLNEAATELANMAEDYDE